MFSGWPSIYAMILLLWHVTEHSRAICIIWSRKVYLLAKLRTGIEKMVTVRNLIVLSNRKKCNCAIYPAMYRIVRIQGCHRL